MIVVTGPESTGTRMMSRMLGQAGGIVRHWPLPQGNVARWPPLPSEGDVVIMVRDRRSTICAQIAAGHVVDQEQAEKNVRRAYRTIFEQLPGRNWFIVSYESLARESALTDLCKALGLLGVPIDRWQDANAKYYGGEEWSDHRNVNGFDVLEHHRKAHKEARCEQ